MFEDIPGLLVRMFALTLSLGFHEAAHAWVAYRLGDDTAKRMGRLTLNPLVHLDPLGTLMMLGPMPIGWAKPVPVNPANINNPRSGLPLVAFAGPLSNLILALFFCILYFIVGQSLGKGAYTMLYMFIRVNLGLAIFNLLPIAPLDGSKIITTFMSDKVADKYEEVMARLGVFPLIAIIAVGAMGAGPGLIGLWFRFWRPLIFPILGLFDVPLWFYPGFRG
jgi:Zn-dependent protease